MVATEFYYDGISSKVYNLIIGSFSGGGSETQAMGNVTMTVIKAPHSNTFLKANSTYNEQLQISFSILKANCHDRNDYIFTEREIGFIHRWLARKDFKKLRFVQEGWENIHYNAVLKVDQHMIGGECCGFDVVATCDAPWGYDQTQITYIESEPIIEYNADGTETITGYEGHAQIHDDSDEIGCIYPKVEIEVLGDCNISIENEFSDTQTIIKNCKMGEKITMSNFSLESTECIADDTGATYKYNGKHPTLYDDFNWTWIPICNYFTPNNTADSRINNINVNGNCIIKLSWDSPRKAVV